MVPSRPSTRDLTRDSVAAESWRISRAAERIKDGLLCVVLESASTSSESRALFDHANAAWIQDQGDYSWKLFVSSIRVKTDLEIYSRME